MENAKEASEDAVQLAAAAVATNNDDMGSLKQIIKTSTETLAKLLPAGWEHQKGNVGLVKVGIASGVDDYADPTSWPLISRNLSWHKFCAIGWLACPVSCEMQGGCH
eukprot:scaffold344825_cov41-Prasinocladus_malaysianus.AAC.1